MITTAIILMLQAAGPAATAPVLTSPDWAERPSGAEVSKSYPSRAGQLGYAGQATLSCVVEADGHLAGCKVLSEEPADRGFGDAALGLSVKFRMRPQTKDGQPVAGGIVRIPIRFIYPGMRLEPLQASHPQLPEGHADLNCRTGTDHLLENCFLESLTPQQDALRATALKLAQRFRVPDSTPSGLRVVLPIDFHTAPAPATK